MVGNEDIALKTRQPQEKAEKPTAPAPQGPTLDPVTEVWTPAPEPADVNAAFRGAVQAILKAGDLLNRRHYFLAEDGVTKVWVDGSSLGYEQLADLNEVLPSKAVVRWLKVQPDGRDLALDFLDIEKDVTRRVLRAWLIDRDREDLAASLPKEFK